MRQCRGLTKDGEWVYGDLVNLDMYGDADNEGKLAIHTYGIYNKEVEVIPETVGQAIGRTDKNSKEIYEGDRLRTPPYKWEGYKFEAKEIIVKWYAGRGDSGFTLIRTGYNISWEDCEITGNTHQPLEDKGENP